MGNGNDQRPRCAESSQARKGTATSAPVAHRTSSRWPVASMDDYEGSLAQGSVLFSDSVDWEVHAGPVDVTSDMPAHVEKLRAAPSQNSLRQREC